MSIDPNIFSSPGSIPGVTSALVDLDRRVSAMETARTFIGSGTIEGGPDGHIVAASITSAEINTGSLAAESALIDFLSAGTIETKSIVASAADIDKLHADTIAANTITAAQIAAGTITANEIAAHTITAANIGAGTITATEIAAASITGDRLVANTITASQIAAGTITATQIATGTITTSLMTAGTINADRLSSGTITSGLLATNSVTSAAIVSGAVTSTKISVAQLSAIAADMGTITAGTITGATLRTASSGKRVVLDSTGITAYGGTGSTVVLNFDTTTGNLQLLGTVTASSSSIIPASTIDPTGTGIVSAQIQNGTVVGADIAARTIAAGNIIADSITAAEIATDAITTNEILARTILAGDIATGTLTANEIQAGSITADRLSVTQLSAIAADLGTITAGTITGATIRTGSGNRVEMNGTNLKVVSSSTDVVTLDPTNGLVFTATSSLTSVSALTWKASGVTRAQMGASIGSGILDSAVTISQYDSSGNGRNIITQLTTPGGVSNTTVVSNKTGSVADYSLLRVHGDNGVTAELFRSSVLKTTTLIDANGDMTVARNAVVGGDLTFNGTGGTGNVPKWPVASGAKLYAARLTCSVGPSIANAIGVTGITRTAAGAYSITHTATASSYMFAGVGTAQGNSNARANVTFQPTDSTHSALTIVDQNGTGLDTELVYFVGIG